MEGAGAGLMQQIRQDLASWKCTFHSYIVLEAENPGCAAHIKRTASWRTSCWMWTDLKKGTTDNTMARHTISPGPCTAMDYTLLHLVV